MKVHNYSPFIFVVLISILPFIYTQNAPEDHVNVPNVARKEVGFYTNCGPCKPCKPCEPCKPSGPCKPCGPCGPSGPCGPANNDEVVIDHGNAAKIRADYERDHNAIRKEHGLGPVTWNATIAKYAQDFAEQRMSDCILKHSMGGQGYAESVGIAHNVSAAVYGWASEEQFWNPVTKECQPEKVCGHYLQVVAKEGIQIGCAIAECTNNKPWSFAICDYWQPPAT